MYFMFNVEAHHGGNSYSGSEWIAAYSYEHAKSYIQHRLTSAGWTVDKIEGHQIIINDIRDKCDQVTE